MPQIELNEEVFQTAQRRAADAGFTSVDEYIADILVHDQIDDMAGHTPDLDYLFTPERIAHIDAAMADVRAGKSYSTGQAAQELK